MEVSKGEIRKCVSWITLPTICFTSKSNSRFWQLSQEFPKWNFCLLILLRRIVLDKYYWTKKRVGDYYSKDGDNFSERHSILDSEVAIIYYSCQRALWFFFFSLLDLKIRTEVQKSEIPYSWSQNWLVVLAKTDSRIPKFWLTISTVW